MTSLHLLVYQIIYTHLGKENRVITKPRYKIIYGRIGLLISQLLLFVSAHDMIFIVFSVQEMKPLFPRNDVDARNAVTQ